MSLREVIDEIALFSPAASQDEIVDAAVKAIESELPKIFRTIKLPRTPSPLYIGKKGFEMGRLRKGHRESFRTQQNEHEVLLSEIAGLQFALDGTASSDFPTIGTINANGGPLLAVLPDTWSRDLIRPNRKEAGIPSQPGIEDDAILRRRPNIQKNLETNILDAIAKEEPVKVEPTERLKFLIDQRIQSQLLSQKSMATFLRTVETAVRKFSHGYKLTWNFDIGEQPDIEEPDWIRMVLRIHPSNMEFDIQMQLWERLDKAIRTAVATVKEDIPTPESEYVDKLNKNLFVELDLD